MTKTRSGLYVYVTWLARLMSGESACQWSVWFKTRHDYTRRPSDFDLVAWLAEHTRLVNELAKERLALGEKCYRESQNQFRVRRKSGLIVSGKPDLITVDIRDHYCVYDSKTGNPKQSDVMQLMLYMALLPLCPLCSGRSLDGYLVYKSGQKQAIPAGAIDAVFKDNISYFLELLEQNDAPPKVPHPNGCRFCDIADEDCTDRMELTETETELPDLPL